MALPEISTVISSSSLDAAAVAPPPPMDVPTERIPHILQQLGALSRFTGPTGVPFLDGLYDLDATAVYYRFLFRLVQALAPQLIVELGVCTARGTAHMAAAAGEAVIVAVDPSPMDIGPILQRYPRIHWLKDLSCSPAVLDAVPDGSVDLCFIDTLHEYDLVSRETRMWLPKMKRGGIMVFDDLTLNDGMRKFWDELTLPKVALPWLHFSGFGIALAYPPDLQERGKKETELEHVAG